MKIAVFGGSFDPVHIEHIQLVKAAMKELSLDKLVVMPAHSPPHKQGKSITLDEDRLACCRLAFAKIEGVEVSPYEMEQGGVSYTYLTCRALREKYPRAELFWLAGTDMLRDFPSWRNPKEILSYVTLAVCGRNEKAEWVEEEQEKFFRAFGKKFVYLSYNGKDVSSTKLRVLAGAGMRLTGFTPPEVEGYICERGLYEIKGAKEALALESPKRQAHSLRVAELAVARSCALKIPERQALTAALFHDCAKNLSMDSPYLEGFSLPTEWGKVPSEVAHQFMGAYVAEKHFGVTDGEVLNAIRYHTSGRAGMSALEKLVFLADMLEAERSYEGVDELRALFWRDIDECMERALRETLRFLEKKGGEIYPLTRAAYAYYEKDK